LDHQPSNGPPTKQEIVINQASDRHLPSKRSSSTNHEIVINQARDRRQPSTGPPTKQELVINQPDASVRLVLSSPPLPPPALSPSSSLPFCFLLALSFFAHSFFFFLSSFACSLASRFSSLSAFAASFLACFSRALQILASRLSRARYDLGLSGGFIAQASATAPSPIPPTAACDNCAIVASETRIV
jgi:hypothetical protein